MSVCVDECIFRQFFPRKERYYNTSGLEERNAFLGPGYVPTQCFCIELLGCLKVLHA
jgi:hypothetical protein